MSIGLRMVGGRGTIELFADGSRAHRGLLDTVEAYLAGRYCDPRRARTAVPAAWAQMIDNYLVTLSAAGRPRTTMTLRRIQLVRMARELGVAPSEVTGESFRPLPRENASTSLEARSFGELAADDVGGARQNRGHHLRRRQGQTALRHRVFAVLVPTCRCRRR